MNTLLSRHNSAACRTHRVATQRARPRIEPVAWLQADHFKPTRFQQSSSEPRQRVSQEQSLKERERSDSPAVHPPPGSGGSGGGGDDEREFRINFGRAVRALQDDLPEFFQHGVQQEVYHPNVQLDAAWLHMSGWRAYSWSHACLRTAARLLFGECELRLLRLWSPQSGVMRARCRLVATPWGAGLLLKVVQSLEDLRPGHHSHTRSGSPGSLGEALGHQQGNASEPRQYTGVTWHVELLFTYKFSSKGYISQHIVERLAPIDPTPVQRVSTRIASTLRQASPTVPQPDIITSTGGQQPPTLSAEGQAGSQASALVKEL